MGALSYRAAKYPLRFYLTFCDVACTPAFAETPTINAADTAWMIVATALVLMMTIPGLAPFYAGMVRKKNVLATMAQSLAAVATISILWVTFGYSLAFVGDGPWLGTLDRWFLAGMTNGRRQPCSKDDSGAGTEGSDLAIGSESHKADPSSDCRLQLACMKPELLVIVDQNATGVYVFPGSCTHRPSHHGS